MQNNTTTMLLLCNQITELHSHEERDFSSLSKCKTEYDAHVAALSEAEYCALLENKDWENAGTERFRSSFIQSNNPLIRRLASAYKTLWIVTNQYLHTREILPASLEECMVTVTPKRTTQPDVTHSSHQSKKTKKELKDEELHARIISYMEERLETIPAEENRTRSKPLGKVIVSADFKDWSMSSCYSLHEIKMVEVYNLISLRYGNPVLGKGWDGIRLRRVDLPNSPNPDHDEKRFAQANWDDLL